MARVAVAYVEVRPDLSGFGDKLQTAVRSMGDVAGKRLGRTVGDKAGKALGPGLVAHFKQATAQLAKRQLDYRKMVHAEMQAEILAGIKEQEQAAADTAKRQLEYGKRAHAQMQAEILDGIKEQETLAAGAAKSKLERDQRAHAQMQAEILDGIKEQENVASAAAKRRLDYNKTVHAQMQAEILSGIKEQEEMQRKADKVREDSAKALLASLGRNRTRVEAEGRRQGKGFADGFINQMKLGFNLRLGQLAPILGLVAVTAAPLAQILSSVAGGLVSVGAAAGVMAAGLGVAGVSAMLAFGQAAGVAAFASKGLGDSLKALDNIQTKVAAGIAITQGDLNNYNEAMQRLSPSAQKVVTALGSVNGQLASIRKTVQERLFAGVADDIKGLAGTYLPVLQSQLAGTAGVLNKAGKEFGAWAKQSSVVRQVSDIMAGNTRIVGSLAKAIVPLAGAAVTLVHAFQPLGELLARYVGSWGQAIGRTVAAAEASGRLAMWVDLMRTAMVQAFRIVGNLGKALGAAFTSVLGPGFTLLDLIEDLTVKLAAWTNSMAGRNAMANWAGEAIPTLKSLGRLVRDVAKMFGRLAGAGDAATFVDQLRTILPPLERLLTQLSASNAAGAFAKGLAEIGQALADLGAGGMLARAVELAGFLLHNMVALIRVVPGLTTVISALIGALATLAAIRLIAPLLMLRQIPFLIGGIKATTTAVRGFTGGLIGLQTVTKANQVGAALSNLGSVVGFVGTSMKTAAGRTALMTLAVRGLSAAIAANPVGAVIVGLTVAGVAMAKFRGEVTKTQGVWEAWVESSTKGVGANTKAATDAAVKDLHQKAKEASEGFANAFSESADKTAQNYRDMANEILAATGKLRDQFGSGTDQLVAKVREMGVSTETSTVDIVVALSRVQKAAGTTKLSQYELAKATAQNFGAMNTNLHGYAYSSSWAAISDQMERARFNGKTWAEAQADQIQMQINNLDKLYIVAYRTAGAMKDVEQAQYEKAVGKAFMAHKNAQAAEAAARKSGETTQKTISGGDAFKGALSAGISSIATKTGATAGKKTAAGFISTFKPALSKLSSFTIIKGKTAYNTGREIAVYIAKGITSGSKNISRVATYIQKTYGKSLTAMVAKNNAFWTTSKNIAKALPDFAKKMKSFTSGAQLDTYLAGRQAAYTKLLDQIKDFKANVVQALTAGADMTGYFGFLPTPGEVQAKLDAMLKRITDFTTGLAELQKKGLSKELAASWLQSGVEGAGNMVKGLQAATPEEIAAINAKFKQINTTAATAADSAATSYYGVGQATVEGYIKGIASMRAAASKEMTALIEYVYKGVKTKLKIKSPSQLYAGLGVNTMAGYIQGVAGMQAATVNTVGRLYDAVTNVPPASLGVPRVKVPTADVRGIAANGAAGNQATYVKVFVGDKEITDIVRVETQRIDEQQARALYAGRRGV